VCYHDVMTKKTTTVRLDEELSATVEMVARTEGVSMNTFVAEALQDRIEKVRKDTEFMSRLATLVERDKVILDRLAR